MPLFRSSIRLTGKHAIIMQKYSKDKKQGQDVPFIVSNNEGHPISCYVFDTRAHAYLCAGMLGILSGRKAEPDSSFGDGKAMSATSTIMYDMVDKQRGDFDRLYRFMVLSEATAENVDAKIKQAFTLKRSNDEWDAEQKKLEDYVRGGLEIIDEKFSTCKTYEDICNAIIDVVGEDE